MNSQAGVQWGEAYAFAEAHNITLVGGGCCLSPKPILCGSCAHQFNFQEVTRLLARSGAGFKEEATVRFLQASASVLIGW